MVAATDRERDRVRRPGRRAGACRPAHALLRWARSRIAARRGRRRDERELQELADQLISLLS